MRQFRIKICGIKTVEDAMRVIESGADAIGLNFYEKSKRYVEAYSAMEISTAVHSVIATVGVFVNSPSSDIAELAEHLRLSAIQLHGDEEPAIADALDGIDIIRALRVPEAESDEELEQVTARVQRDVDHWVSVGVKGILLDAHSKNGFGGTGEAFNWKVASRLDVPVPLILAGGLEPENVEDAILGVAPDAVDVASGVEASTGGKDRGKMLRFSTNAREAFERLKEQQGESG